MITSSPSIVLIDKHSAYLSVLSNFIRSDENLPFVLHTAHSAQDGLNLVSQIKPTIILVDFNLPEMNGLELLPQLRYLSPGSKLIVSTLSDDPIYRQAAEQSGADAFISKADIYDDLPHTLQRLAPIDQMLATM